MLRSSACSFPCNSDMCILNAGCCLSMCTWLGHTHCCTGIFLEVPQFHHVFTFNCWTLIDHGLQYFFHSFQVGTSLGATRGLLLRGGNVLEKFSMVNSVVFDKTGTLTIGRPVVTKVVSLGGMEITDSQ